MTFAIATSEITHDAAKPRLYDGNVTFRGFGDRALRKKRQIIAAIEICDTEQEVEDTLIEQDLILDAFLLDYPDYYEEIRDAADTQKAILAHGTDHASDAGAPAPMAAIAHNVLNKTF